MSNKDLSERLARTEAERKRLADDVGRLRRHIAQQLTRTSELVTTIREIDGDYFGDRFFSQSQSEGEEGFFNDLRVAREAVAAIAEELSGIGAFADSPALRDGIHDLVQAMESLRDRAIELDRESLEAVGLPSTGPAFSAHTFPENNPFACIREAGLLINETEGVVRRTGGRIQALLAMAQQADEVRSRAETDLEEMRAKPGDIAETARAELGRAEEELATLRAEVATIQEARREAEHAHRSEVEALARDLEDAHQQHRADIAEVRSLSGELVGLGEQHLGPDAGPALEDLRRALAEGEGAAAILTAAEGALVRLVDHLGAAGGGLDAEAEAEWQRRLDDAQRRAGELEAQLAAAEQRAGGAEGAAEARIQELTAELEARRQQLDEAEAAQRELHSRLENAQQQARTAQVEADAGRDAIIELREEARDLREADAGHRRTLEHERDERDRVVSELREVVQAAERGLEEARKRIGRLESERDNLAERLRTATDTGDAASGELQALRSELNGLRAERDELERELAGERDRAAGADSERTRLAAELQGLERARTEVEEAHSQSDQAHAERIDDLERELAAARRHAGDLEPELERLRAAEESRGARIAELEDEIRTARDELERQLAEARRELERLSAVEVEHSSGLERLKAAEERVADLEAELGSARGELEGLLSVQAERESVAERLQDAEAQVASLERELEASRETVEQLRAELEADREHLAAARQERDAAIRQAATLEGDLKQLRDQLDYQEAQARADTAQSMERSQERIDSLEAQLDEQRAEVAAGRERLAEAESELEQLRAQVAAMEAKLAEHKMARDRGQVALAAALDEAEKVEQELGRVREQLAERERAATGLESRIEELQRELQEASDGATDQIAAQEASAALERKASDAERQRDELEVELQRSRDELAALRKELEVDLEAARQVVADQKGELEELRTLNEEREGELRAAHTRIDMLDQELAEARDQVTETLAKPSEELTRRLNELGDEVLAARDQVRVVGEERDRLANQVALLGNQLEQARSETTDGGERVAELEAELERLMQERGSTTSAHSELRDQILEQQRLREQEAEAHASAQAAWETREAQFKELLLAARGAVQQARDEMADYEQRIAELEARPTTGQA